MMPLEQIKNFFPPYLRDDKEHQKYMLKEYLQLLILDFLSASIYARKITFIGGTSLRLVKGIDRFSEDLDFDCKDLSKEEFTAMTDSIIQFLKRNGFKAEARDKTNDKLTAFRRNIHFPQFLFEMGLSGYREERFLVKVEAQDQLVNYTNTMATIRGCGFLFSFPVPPDPILCSMKLSALLSRAKGRDFYDAIFLLGQTKPDYIFLAQRCNIHNLEELKAAIMTMLEKIDLGQKSKDFEHLLFNKQNKNKILLFKEFIDKL